MSGEELPELTAKDYLFLLGLVVAAPVLIVVVLAEEVRLLVARRVGR